MVAERKLTFLSIIFAMLFAWKNGPAFICMIYLQRYRGLDRWKVGVWSWTLAALSVAALLGAVVHGLELSDAMKTLLWRPLYLLLAIVVALFVVAASYDWLGERSAWPVLVAGLRRSFINKVPLSRLMP